VARLEESSDRSIRLYKQSKLASINKHYYKAPEKFSCCGPNFLLNLKGLKREVGIRA
jgi:hypothetical protein